MIITPEKTTFVLVGHWNRHIFTPAWVGSNIFQTQSVQVEFPLNANVAPRYSFDSVSCLLSGEKLIYTALSHSDEVLTRLRDYALRSLRLLPFTPIGAYGFNLGYQESPIPPEIAGVFNTTDNERIVANGNTISDYLLKRTISIAGSPANFSISNIQNMLNLDFNYNYLVTSCTQAIEQLPQLDLVLLRNSSLEFIRRVYGLSTDGTV